MKRFLTIASFCLVLPAFSIAQAQSLYRPSSVASGDASMAGFGGTVAIGVHDVFVGEPANAQTPGLVHVFRRDLDGTSWINYARLRADDGTIGDRFGTAISADAASILIGAPQQRDGAGAAYIFEQNIETGAWVQKSDLTPSEAAAGEGSGSEVALGGEWAFVSSPGKDERAGGVYVFRRDASTGVWFEHSAIRSDDAQAGDRFGSAVALAGEMALVSAPGKDANTGMVYVFSFDGSTNRWSQTGRVVPSTMDEGALYGATISVTGQSALISSPRAKGAIGQVSAFTFDSVAGLWNEEAVLVPVEETSQSWFGISSALSGSEAWIGAPGVDGRTGAVFGFVRSDDGTWRQEGRIAADGMNSRDSFGGTLSVKGNVAVIGVVGADFGAGTAVIFERNADGDWVEQSTVFSTGSGLAAVTGGEIDCSDGKADAFDCSDVDLVAFLPVEDVGGGRGVRVNDIWGWTDAESGREYAIVGMLDGTSFIDVTDAENPIYVGKLPKTEISPGSTWRDIKVFDNHAFVVADGAGPHGMQIFNLAKLRDVSSPPVVFEEDAHYDGIASAHNIVINEETGYAFTVGNSSGGETCGGGLHIINIREPLQPTFAGCFADAATGRKNTGYTHDAQCVTYLGPDAEHTGKEVCFGANETALSIADVTDKENPVALSNATYPSVAYSHQGWLTDDHRYFFMNDELDELQGGVDGTRTIIWDVSDLDDPQLVKEHISENKSSDHNLYIKGDLMYQSNYQSGLRILDISDVQNPVEVGFFDTVPYGENKPGFGGSWSNYPYFKSGIIVVTSGFEGVFVLKKKDIEL